MVPKRRLERVAVVELVAVLDGRGQPPPHRQRELDPGRVGNCAHDGDHDTIGARHQKSKRHRRTKLVLGRAPPGTALWKLRRLTPLGGGGGGSKKLTLSVCHRFYECLPTG